MKTKTIEEVLALVDKIGNAFSVVNAKMEMFTTLITKEHSQAAADVSGSMLESFESFGKGLMDITQNLHDELKTEDPPKEVQPPQK